MVTSQYYCKRQNQRKEFKVNKYPSIAVISNEWSNEVKINDNYTWKNMENKNFMSLK